MKETPELLLAKSYSVVGVVGHIDHGKTSLVAALTGVDTDTHPEEKQRGITIDLGFAHWNDTDAADDAAEGGELQRTFAFIDAPGHQKYIGNLLAGVSHVDIGLLVVACDQGIQEQTLEHVAILRMLGVERLVVVISRVDLADDLADGAADELADELTLFLGEYGFADFPIVRVSTLTGQGLDELRSTLRDLAVTPSAEEPDGPLRIPVDRVFTVPGRGCVVAGVIWSGEVQVGDEVELPRLNVTARVRGLESHGETVDHLPRGRRVAVNLSGVSANDVVRGDEAISPGSHQLASRFLAEIRLFPDAQPVRCPATVQLHTATTHCEARLTGVREVGAGEPVFAIVETSPPVIATYRQLGLIRRPYPVGSFAGLEFLGSLDGFEHRSKQILREAPRLASRDPAERLRGWVEALGEWELSDAQAQRLGVSRQALDAAAEELQQQEGVLLEDNMLIAPAAVQRSRGYQEKLLAAAAASDDAWLVEDALLERAKSTGSPVVRRLALAELLQSKRAVRLNHRIALSSDKTRLSKRQRARMDDLLQALRGQRMPPTIKELAERLDEPAEMLTSLGRFATQQGLLVELGPGLLIARDVLNELAEELYDAFRQQPSLTASEIKSLWDVTRKYAIPLLEHFDQQGQTVRHGDQRSAAKDWKL